MWSTDSPWELGSAVAPEFNAPDDPKSDSVEETADATVTGVETVGSEEAFGAGVLGLCASARQRSVDDDDDSDLGFDDPDYEDDDLDEDELDDDFEDEELDDDLDEQVDDEEL